MSIEGQTYNFASARYTRDRAVRKMAEDVFSQMQPDQWYCFRFHEEQRLDDLYTASPWSVYTVMAFELGRVEVDDWSRHYTMPKYDNVGNATLARTALDELKSRIKNKLEGIVRKVKRWTSKK